ncbi:MAG TPA: hypothetical protein VIT44_18225 [Cyclobacteriaceae bacterium]
MSNPTYLRRSLLSLFLFFSLLSYSQDLYTARGYWEESNKPSYQSIKKKQMVGDSLSNNEQLYLADYETHLTTYYGRLSEEEKIKYAQMKADWDRGRNVAPVQKEGNLSEGRRTNWLANGFYGLYYGLSIIGIGEIDGPAAVGIPLITSGLWMLGPVIRPKKYEFAIATTLRAGNTGRMLGLGYGASLALAIGGDNDNTGKLALGLSSIASMALGEIGFNLQKKKNLSIGHIDLIRHYNFLGAWTALAVLGSTETDNANLLGASLLVGGISGFMIGNKAAKKYDYTRGDVDAISTLTLITTGLGLTAVVETLSNNNNSSSNNVNALILIPAASSIAGTLLAQKAVKGAHLTDRQGSIINWATIGTALVGVGGVAFTDTDSPAVYIGVPSALALITHQILFHKFKMKNIESGFRGGLNKKLNYKLSFKATPENYFINKMMLNETRTLLTSSVRQQNPLATLKITF